MSGTTLGRFWRPVLAAAVAWLVIDAGRKGGMFPAALDAALGAGMGQLRGAPWSAAGANVVITGASSGIGEELAYHYARQGAHVTISARRAEELARVAKACAEKGAASVHTIVADVAAEDGWNSINAESPDTVDLLVLNAGISMGTDWAQLSKINEAVRITRKLVDVNYMGSVGVLDALLPALLASKTGVRVAVISSIAGLAGIPTRTAYSASKFALKGFFDGLRREFTANEHPAVITMVYPGVVKTDINRLREGPKGQTQSLDMTKGYDVDHAALVIGTQIAEGARDVVMSVDGTATGLVLAKALQFLDYACPSVADVLLARKMKAMQSVQKE